MKIYKISQRMFNTYEMEDLLMSSFRRHYDAYIKGNTWYKQGLLESGRFLIIGKMRIGSLLEKIFKEHGIPKKPYAKTVFFGLVASDNKRLGGQKMNAFFSADDRTGALYIYKVVDNIKDLDFDDSFKSTLAHELQHLLKHIYEPKGIFGEESTSLSSGFEYFSLPREIQSFCSAFAAIALKSWINITVQYALRIFTTEKVLEKIQLWRTPKNLSTIFNIFALNKFRDFDEISGNVISSDQDLKKKYLYYTYRNLEMLLNQYLDNLETKTKQDLSSGN